MEPNLWATPPPPTQIEVVIDNSRAFPQQGEDWGKHTSLASVGTRQGERTAHAGGHGPWGAGA